VEIYPDFGELGSKATTPFSITSKVVEKYEIPVY
jgi:hypothetical protein